VIDAPEHDIVDNTIVGITISTLLAIMSANTRARNAQQYASWQKIQNVGTFSTHLDHGFPVTVPVL